MHQVDIGGVVFSRNLWTPLVKGVDDEPDVFSSDAHEIFDTLQSKGSLEIKGTSSLMLKKINQFLTEVDHLNIEVWRWSEDKSSLFARLANKVCDKIREENRARVKREEEEKLVYKKEAEAREKKKKATRAKEEDEEESKRGEDDKREKKKRGSKVRMVSPVRSSGKRVKSAEVISDEEEEEEQLPALKRSKKLGSSLHALDDEAEFESAKSGEESEESEPLERERRERRSANLKTTRGRSRSVSSEKSFTSRSTTRERSLSPTPEKPRKTRERSLSPQKSKRVTLKDKAPVSPVRKGKAQRNTTSVQKETSPPAKRSVSQDPVSKRAKKRTVSDSAAVSRDSSAESTATAPPAVSSMSSMRKGPRANANNTKGRSGELMSAEVMGDIQLPSFNDNMGIEWVSYLNLSTHHFTHLISRLLEADLTAWGKRRIKSLTPGLQVRVQSHPP